jgi:hypothetical protein
MKVSIRLIGFTACLATALLGCERFNPRPSDVPSSAVRVDKTFIDCSAESESRGNRCTVYREDSGEILADGLFLTMTTHVTVDKSELQYAAFGHGMIYLQNGRVLEHVAPSKGDPSLKKITERLEALAMKGSSKAIDCNAAGAVRKAEDCSACARRSFADGKAFYFSYYEQGRDSFEFKGIAANEAGDAYEVEYESAWVGERENLAKTWQLLDDNHTLIMPCPKPVTLYREGDWLTCRLKLME